ncbi:hypothetical protein B4U79_08974, partial [Dinothrombium tinctorium]
MKLKENAFESNHSQALWTQTIHTNSLKQVCHIITF